jgi:hypothetical protein
MKNLFALVAVCGLVAGCATVQKAQFDKTRPPTQKVDFYQSPAAVNRQFKEIGYLAYTRGVNDLNDTYALGKLLDAARRIGADGVILQSPNLSQTNLGSFKAIAIVYQP